MTRSLRQFRPVTRELLAKAIEYSMDGVLDGDEHEHYFVTHYHDPLLEKARVLTIRQYFIAGLEARKLFGSRHLTREHKKFLMDLAQGLRNGNLDHLNLEHPIKRVIQLDNK